MPREAAMKWSVLRTAAALLVTAWSSLAGGQFVDLLQLLPGEANVLVVLNAEKIFASPLAVKEGWRQRYEESFAAAPMLLPPKAQQFVLAAKLGLEFMEPQWEVAVTKLSRDPTVAEVAKRVKGDIDRIGGAEAVETPRGGYIVKFAPNTFGLMVRADRQAASRWVSAARASTSIQLAPYLKEAAGYAENLGTEIIMALDLRDVVQAEDVRQAMEQSAAMKQSQVDLDALSALLSSIQGVTLGVTLSDKAFGKLKVDFGRDAAILKGFAKPLLLEILAEAGAAVDEFADWKEQLDGNRLSIEGYLTDSGLRRLFSILEIDSSAVDPDEPKSGDQAAATAPAGSEETKAYTSRQYFQAVSKYLRDLKLERGAKSVGQYGLWFEKYARKIDKLPILNVDPELVDYGQMVSNYLRDAVTAIQGVGIRSGAREAQVYNQGYVSANYSGYGPAARVGVGGWRVYGGYSGYAEAYFNDVDGQRRAIRAEERAKGAASARDVMKEITLATNQIRRKMTERYKVEF
ncbi:MAG: hypothetical protein A2W31_09275 [Planctomycetes bacterium RBG_16_64_10]|nr:MAG: hypothetical protein A2W31_09275 [Planctomycetes bacterium RBG_16_64_10]